MPKQCTHIKDHMKDVKPHTKGCEECLQSGDTWVHLRMCLECGHVGCCDSSKNRHARGHFHHAASADSLSRARRRLALVLYRRELFIRRGSIQDGLGISGSCRSSKASTPK
jgi:hypothetical protein